MPFDVMESEDVVAPQDQFGSSRATAGRIDAVLQALDTRIEAFHVAVAAAEDEVRNDLIRRRGRSAFAGEQALVELGPFAVGRIDPERFSLLMGGADDGLTPEVVDVLQRSDTILQGFSESMAIHRVRVEPRGDLRDAVKRALQDVGQLFGAARAVELARNGVYEPERDGHLLEKLPFRFWNRAERQLAPPIVVEVQGDDCLPAGLGEFLDGGVTIVLVVDGTTAPAPLARLITPGTFVMQTADVEELGRLAASSHPGIALLFDGAHDDQAWFLHDPDGGDAIAQRLSVTRMPDIETVGRGRRVPAWLDDVVHLQSLARQPGATSAGADGQDAATDTVGAGAPAGPQEGRGDAADPAGRLAAWLLARTDLTNL